MQIAQWEHEHLGQHFGDRFAAGSGELTGLNLKHVGGRVRSQKAAIAIVDQPSGRNDVLQAAGAYLAAGGEHRSIGAKLHTNELNEQADRHEAHAQHDRPNAAVRNGIDSAAGFGIRRIFAAEGVCADLAGSD